MQKSKKKQESNCRMVLSNANKNKETSQQVFAF